MTQLDGFLQSGAVYRGSNDDVYVWSDLQIFDTQKTFSSPLSYVASQDYFQACLNFYQSNVKPQVIKVTELRSILRHWVADRSCNLARTDFVPASKEGFERSFREIQLKISRGEISKAVPMIRSQAPETIGIVDRAIFLERLLEAPDRLSVYGIWNSESGILGATPEQLFQYKDGVLSSMALAGTCPVEDKDKRLDLLNDPKELAEHQIVKNEVLSYLEKYGVVRLFPTEVVQYSTLLHLRTLMEVSVSSFDVNDFVKRVHPTSALGVSPKNYGWGWLKELPEQLDRKKFGAPIVFQINPDHQVGLVAIRNVQWNKDVSFVCSGCGIVSQSHMQQEWQEVLAKMNSIFSLLGL